MFPVSATRLRHALARRAYDRDRIRIVDRDVAGFDCLASSALGLFAVGRNGASRLLIHGFFFGICRDGDAFYLMESGGHPHASDQMGRIVRFAVRNGRIEEEHVFARGLPNGCHQLALIGDVFCLVDTYAQRVWRIDREGSVIDNGHLFPGNPVFHHPNSIAAWQGGYLILLHNGAQGGTGPSELAWFDADWIERRRITLPGHCCHDIVADEKGLLWHCGSMAGELINSDGLRIGISDLMTRGLIVTPDMFVIGASVFGRRDVRDDLGGAVTFLDRSFRRLAEVTLPAAPKVLIEL